MDGDDEQQKTEEELKCSLGQGKHMLPVKENRLQVSKIFNRSCLLKTMVRWHSIIDAAISMWYYRVTIK